MGVTEAPEYRGGPRSVGKHAGGAAALRSTSARAPARRHVATRATFSQVFAVGEFRALWLAMLLSVGGDPLPRVAITMPGLCLSPPPLPPPPHLSAPPLP